MSPLRTGALLTALVTAAAGGGWAAASRTQSPQEVALARAAPTASLITVPVERRQLTSVVTTRATVRSGQPRMLTLPTSALKGGVPGRITRLPVTGVQLRENSVAMEVSGSPVVVLTGTVPMYRDLRPGDEGADVLQLEQALDRLGLRSGEIDGRYDAATEGAVDEWMSQLGYEAEGPSDERRQSLRTARSEVAAAEDRLLQARTALETGTKGATGVELAEAVREVRAAERAVTDAEAQVGVTRSRVTVARANGATNEASQEVAGRRVLTARQEALTVEAAEAAGRQRVVLAERQLESTRAKVGLAERAVAAAQRREAAATRAIDTAARRRAAMVRAVEAATRRVGEAVRAGASSQDRLAQARRTHSGAAAREQLARRAESTARADEARENLLARHGLDTARRAVDLAKADQRLAAARLRALQSRAEPSAGDLDEQAAAADVQRAEAAVAGAADALEAALTAVESTRLRAADGALLAARAVGDAEDATAAALLAVHEGQFAAATAAAQVRNAEDDVAAAQDQVQDAEEALAAARDARTAAGDEIAGEQVAVLDARDTVLTAEIAVTDARNALGTAALATRRAQDAVHEALAGEVSSAAATLAAVTGIDEASATAGSALSTVAGARDLLLVAQARRDQLRQPKDAQALRQAVELGERALAEAKEAFSRLDGATGISVPADEVLFLPAVPLKVDDVKATAGSTADGPLFQVTTGQLVADAAVTVHEARVLEVGASAVLSAAEGDREFPAVLTVVAPQPGTHGAEPQQVHIEVAPDAAAAGLVGASVRLRISVATTEEEVLAVPVAALATRSDGRSQVQVEGERGGVREVVVTPGLEADGLVEVTPRDRLEEGERVVVGAAPAGAAAPGAVVPGETGTGSSPSPAAAPSAETTSGED